MIFKLDNLSDNDLDMLMAAMPDQYFRSYFEIIRDIPANKGINFSRNSKPAYMRSRWKIALRSTVSKAASYLEESVIRFCNDNFPELQGVFDEHEHYPICMLLEIWRLYAERPEIKNPVPAEVLIRAAGIACDNMDVEQGRKLLAHDEVLVTRHNDAEQKRAEAEAEKHKKELDELHEGYADQIAGIQRNLSQFEKSLAEERLKVRELEAQASESDAKHGVLKARAMKAEATLADAVEMLILQTKEALGCTRITAEYLLRQYFKEKTDQDPHAVCDAIVAETVEMVHEGEAFLEARWRKRCHEEISAFEQEKQALKEQIDDQKEALTEIQRKTDDRFDAIDRMEKKAQALAALERQMNETFFSKLNEMRTNASQLRETLSLLFPEIAGDGALRPQSSSQMLPAEATSHEERPLFEQSAFTPSQMRPVNSGPISADTDLSPSVVVRLLSTNLALTGVSDASLSKELAILLLSSYVANVNLVLAGIGAEDIADAFAFGMIHGKPAVLDASLPFCASDMIRTIGAEKLVRIDNAFEGDRLTQCLRIVRACPGTMFLFTAPFAQSLFMEPPGLFNTVLPVFTELYVDESPASEGSVIYVDANDAVSGSVQLHADAISCAIIEDSGFAIPIPARRNLERVVLTAKGMLCIEQSASTHMALFGLIAPLAVCLGKTEAFMSALQGLPDLRDEDRRIMVTFLRSLQ